MSERPNVVLAALLGPALVVATLLAVGMASLAGQGALTAGATVLGAISACFFFLVGAENVPYSSVVIAGLSLASIGGFVHTLHAYRREARILHRLALEPLRGNSLQDGGGAAEIPLFSLRSTRPAAFCFGLWRPRVVLTTALLDQLEADEQLAVVCHELQHARSREPLKCLLARLATNTFFWLPILGALLDRYLLAKELAADRDAMRRTSRPALAGALAQVLSHPGPRAAVGMAEFAAARVDRLFDRDARLPALLRPRQAVISVLSASGLALALMFPSTLSVEQSRQMWEMLTTMSLHGLPGMLAGLLANLLALAVVALLARRAAR